VTARLCKGSLILHINAESADMLVNMLCFGDLTMQESACIDS